MSLFRTLLQREGVTSGITFKDYYTNQECSALALCSKTQLRACLLFLPSVSPHFQSVRDVELSRYEAEKGSSLDESQRPSEKQPHLKFGTQYPKIVSMAKIKTEGGQVMWT